MIPRGSKALKKGALSEIMRDLEMTLEKSKTFRDVE
jgi:hypothetical protein